MGKKCKKHPWAQRIVFLSSKSRFPCKMYLLESGLQSLPLFQIYGSAQCCLNWGVTLSGHTCSGGKKGKGDHQLFRPPTSPSQAPHPRWPLRQTSRQTSNENCPSSVSSRFDAIFGEHCIRLTLIFCSFSWSLIASIPSQLHWYCYWL